MHGMPHCRSAGLFVRECFFCLTLKPPFWGGGNPPFTGLFLQSAIGLMGGTKNRPRVSCFENIMRNVRENQTGW